MVRGSSGLGWESLGSNSVGEVHPGIRRLGKARQGVGDRSLRSLPGRRRASRDWKEGRDTAMPKDRDRKSSAARIRPQTGYSKAKPGRPPVQVWLAPWPQQVGTRLLQRTRRPSPPFDEHLLTALGTGAHQTCPACVPLAAGVPGRL